MKSLLQSREYHRNRKAALLAKGLCYWCGKASPMEGRKRCEACMELARKNSINYLSRRRPAWKALGICRTCGKREAIPNQSRCGACAEWQDTYKAEKRKGVR